MLNRVVEYIKTEINAIRNGKAFVFLVCLVLASFLWFLNALEKHYTDHITVPVRYINLPKNKDLTGKLPAKFDLTVDAYGYTLLRHKLSLAFSPILLDVNELTNNYLESKFMSKYTISTNGHKEEIAKQISSEIEIISIRPDSISFNVSNVIEKLIKVQPVVDVTFAREFILQKSPVVTPDTILVRGTQEILDTLRYINTRPVEMKDLSHTVERDVDLVLLPELKSEISEVTVQIVVEQYTEVKFEVPILIINQPDSLLIKTFPSKVKVSCRVGLSQYNKLNNNSFRAVVDYSHRSGVLSKLKVILDRVPETVLSVDYFPKEVEYIIERKE
ncbi:MAG: YbbR-like domain-containing protein [Bacteroidia bacterium]|nr:YbbR-like domain-containing protein [Bacteroidia bacterium]